MVHLLESNYSIRQSSNKKSNSHLCDFFSSVSTCSTNISHEPLIPDLVAFQYSSFQKFLQIGLTKAFREVNLLNFEFGNEKFEIRFFPESLQFRKPESNAKYAIHLGKTYGCSVYIPVHIQCTNWDTPRIEWLLLGFLPLMTEAGHFVINGIPRVVLHQMVRNPGVYSLEKDSRTRVPTIRIVPEQGSWINITIDKKNRLWITTRLLRRKISALIFLQALGISLSDIYTRIQRSDFLEFSFVKPLSSNEKTRHGHILQRANLQFHPQTQDEALRYIYAHVQEYTVTGREQIVNNENAHIFFDEIIWNSRNRNLGVLGREQFSQKLGSTSVKMLLTSDDMLRATQGLIELVCGERQPDDIDSLNNKRIRGCGDFLHDQLVRGIREFEIVFKRKLSVSLPQDIDMVWKIQKSSISKCVSKSWKSFFTSGTLSQFLDETNPLAETTHKRRITVLGPGGVSGKQTTIQIRGIHPTYYGRLCPIETPEGQNAGLVNSLTVFAKPTINGHIETPFFQVYKGQVQRFSNPIYRVPYQESNLLVAPGDIQPSTYFLLPKTQLPVRKDWKFDYTIWNRIHLQSVGILQLISVATSLIPFLEHDDANRALMGSNMQRQAVPLIQPEAALVRTGLESRVISDVQHSLHSESSGYVTSISAQHVRFYKPINRQTHFENYSISLLEDIVKSNNLSIKFSTSFFSKYSKSWEIPNPYQTFPGKLALKRKKAGLSPPIKGHNFYSPMQFSKTGCVNEYKFDPYQRTNQSTCRFHRPAVNESEWVQKADLIADGAGSVGGKVALGKNVLVAYLPWEGYNFEDAILISERLVSQDIFTSLHIDYYEIEVKNTQYGLETITNQVPIEVTDSDRDLLRIQKLDSQGLIPIGSWVEEGDYLVGKITPLNPKGPSVQQQYEKLYNVIMQRENTHVRNTSLRVPKGVEGFIYSVDILPAKEADVIALAPKEALLRVRIALLQRRRIQVGDKMAGRHGNKGIISKILPTYDMPYLPDGTPIDIVLNPLGVPSRMNVGQILECLLGLAGKYLGESYSLRLFDEQFGAEASRTLVYSKLYQAAVKTINPWLFEPHHPGKIRIFDGRTGESFDQAVTVGYAYMLKLVHLVDDKLHARATGPYSAITQQPVRGRSRNGGQRLGEMEVWALQAYGAAYLLQELLTIKSDDIEGRKEAVFRIYTNQSIQFGPPESFRVLLRELQALCFDLKLFTRDPKTLIKKPLNLQALEYVGKSNTI